MPRLTNHRQERFCQLIKQGIPPWRAYPAAGYKQNYGAPYRLSQNVTVKRRLDEIGRQMAQKTAVTVESISAQLDADREFAQRVDQAGPALNATVAKAKLHGLMVDRKETGQPGDFANLQTVEEVMALVSKEFGKGAADALMQALAASDGTPDLDQDAARSPGDSLN